MAGALSPRCPSEPRSAAVNPIPDSHPSKCQSRCPHDTGTDTCSRSCVTLYRDAARAFSSQ